MIGKSLIIIYVALTVFVRCDFETCLKKHCSNLTTYGSEIKCNNVTLLNSNKYENDSKCFETIHSVSIYFLNGTNVSDLGILKQFKNLYFLKLFDITYIDKNIFNDLSALEHVRFNESIDIKGDKLTGKWRIIETTNDMWLKICGDAIEHYQLPHFSHIISYNKTKFVLENQVEETSFVPGQHLSRQVDGFANFISCVDYYCTKNLFSPIFQCPEQLIKHYSFSKLPKKYQSCLSNVTYLIVPRLVPEITVGSLDFFVNVVKITFLSDVQLFIDNCAFIPLKHLRILDFGKSFVNYNELLTILDNHESPILITHANYSLHRRCDEVKRYKYNGNIIKRDLNQLDPERSPKCNSIGDYLFYILLIVIIIVITGGFVIYRLCTDNCFKKFSFT